MSASKFKFVLTLTGKSKASLEMSGYIGEAARDALLRVLATDFEKKTLSPVKLRYKKPTP